MVSAQAVATVAQVLEDWVPAARQLVDVVEADFGERFPELVLDPLTKRLQPQPTCLGVQDMDYRLTDSAGAIMGARLWPP